MGCEEEKKEPECIFCFSIKESILKEIDKIAEEDMSNREVIVKKMVGLGLREFRKAKAAKLYKEERLSLSEAAKMAGLTMKRMKEYLAEKDYRLDYSILDIERELGIL
ncbi:MAG: hypothetical protein CVT88_07125 [Candidatus Altiarchaeales archaeon HGW-Altiarchaeales-1]|nr:MAG: hypothetical protein CVT88_07125 [Candidatus Altiarchaeales archaeon HGW-Altiarchaeales-1]